MAHEERRELIEEVVREADVNGATPEAVGAALRARGVERSISWVRTELRRLAADQRRLVALSRPTGKPGSNEVVYYHLNAVPRLLNMTDPKTRAELEREIRPQGERDRARRRAEVFGGLAPLVASVAHGVDGDPALLAVREVAAALADENPRALLLELADWVATRAGELEAQYLNARDPGRRRELLRHLGRFREFVQETFRRALNIDRDALRVDPAPLERGAGEPVVRYDRERVRRLLERYVHGATVCEVVDVAEAVERPYPTASSDASIQEILAGQDLPGHFARGAFRDRHAITTSAASLRTPDRDEAYYDFDISPRRIQEYDAEQSITEGLILPGHIRNRLGADKYERCKWAAMNIRQYRHDLKVLNGEAAWRRDDMEHAALDSVRLRRPSVLFRDGRLFPLEHRVDNFEDASLYGEFVRRSISGLASLAAHPRVLGGGAAVCGVVKDPVLALFAPMVLWYAHRARPYAFPEDRVLQASEFTDDELVEPLLRAAAAKVEPAAGRFAVTFRILRRFSTLARLEAARLPANGEPPDSEHDWRAYFAWRLQNGGDEDDEELDFDLDDYAEFILLCGRVGALEFYLHPVDGRLGPQYQLPRYELLVTSAYPDRFAVERERDAVAKVLEGLTAPGALAIDADHIDGPRPVVVPSVLLRAHEAAKFAGGRFKQVLINAVWDLYVATREGDS
jgi:hypothetical protein